MSEDQWGEYLRAKEPGVREKAYAWKTAIGLQKVDGLTPTEYLELFFRNLLLGESNVLQSRYLVVGGWKGPGAPQVTLQVTSQPLQVTS